MTPLEHPFLISTLADHLRPVTMLLLVAQAFVIMQLPAGPPKPHERLLPKNFALLVCKPEVLVAEKLGFLLRGWSEVGCIGEKGGLGKR